MLDDIKAFRERLRSAQPRPPAAQARVRGRFGHGREPSRMGDSATQQGRLPRRPLRDTIQDRPSTTDGVAPRQQVGEEKPLEGHSLLCPCISLRDTIHIYIRRMERPIPPRQGSVLYSVGRCFNRQTHRVSPPPRPWASPFGLALWRACTGFHPLVSQDCECNDTLKQLCLGQTL